MPTGPIYEGDTVSYSIVFQSLFFWMMPTGEIHFTYSAVIIRVSILVLLDDAYRQIDSLFYLGCIAMFQSLFFWMMPTGTCGLFGCVLLLPVSILVLLDDAYRQKLRWRGFEGRSGFNPCSSG